MASAPDRSVFSHVATGCAYFPVAAGTISLTRYDGGVAFLWVATALLTARLTTLPRRAWWKAMLCCGVASVVATVCFGLGAAVALPLAVANIGEAAVGAFVLRRFVGRRAILDSHRWLICFVIACGMVAPAASAIVGPGSVALILGKPFVSNALHWYSGHALGTLAFMPIAIMVLRGDAARLIRETPRDRLLELAALLALVAGVSALAFGQDERPLLFLPLLPIVLATFRGGAISTAASIVIVAVIGSLFTIDGHGPIAMMAGASPGDRMQFLQLYIATTMLTVLPANAELERRAELFRQLRESEARYRLVTESSTDVVLTLDAQGILRYVSASISQFGGRSPEALIGLPISVLVHRDDADRALANLASVIANPDGVAIAEFRSWGGETNAPRWFETHSRAVIDDNGVVTGIVCALRDVTQRKAHEARLALAALTDPLTGLANRRAFEGELAGRIASGAGGCVALFDIDHFKRVNDTYGHSAGDEVLRHFAAIARSSMREQDFVARLGGEEFAVILPEATIEQSRLVCDRLRAAVAGAQFRIADHVIAITVSGGVSRYAPDIAQDDVVRAADEALYRAKNTGRDRLALAA